MVDTSHLLTLSRSSERSGQRIHGTYCHFGLEISACFLHRGKVFVALVSHGTGMLTGIGAGARLATLGLVLMVKTAVLMAEAEVGLLELNFLDLLVLALLLVLMLLIGR